MTVCDHLLCQCILVDVIQTPNQARLIPRVLIRGNIQGAATQCDPVGCVNSIHHQLVHVVNHPVTVGINDRKHLNVRETCGNDKCTGSTGVRG